MNQSRNSSRMRKTRSRKWWGRKYIRNTRKCPWGEKYTFSGWKNLLSIMVKKKKNGSLPKHITIRFQKFKNNEKDSKSFQVQRDKHKFSKNYFESKWY